MPAGTSLPFNFTGVLKVSLVGLFAPVRQMVSEWNHIAKNLAVFHAGPGVNHFNVGDANALLDRASRTGEGNSSLGACARSVEANIKLQAEMEK